MSFRGLLTVSQGSSRARAPGHATFQSLLTTQHASVAGQQRDEEPDEYSQNKVNSRQATLNLIAGGLGTGMYSLPWAVAGASVSLGVLTCFLVIGVNAWTIMIIIEAAEKHQAFDLGALLSYLPGRIGAVMRIVTNVMVWVAMLLSLISYIVAIHDSAQPFVQGTFLSEGRVGLVAGASLLVLPLCFLDQKHLSCTSTVAFLVNLYLVGLICDLFGQRVTTQSLPGHACLFGLSKGNVTMMSAMMQCVIIQMCVLPMYAELEDRSPRKFRRVLLVAFGVLALLFSCFAALGYLVFGQTVNSNALINLPRTVEADVARIGTILVVLAVYPIMVIPMLAPIRSLDLDWFLSRHLRDSLRDLDAVSVEGLRRIALFRRGRVVDMTIVAIVAVSFVGALLIDSLGIINVVDGTICVGVFTSLGPGLIGLYLLDKSSVMWRVSMIILLLIGLVGSIAGLIFTKNFHSELSHNCLWRFDGGMLFF